MVIKNEKHSKFEIKKTMLISNLMINDSFLIRTFKTLSLVIIQKRREKYFINWNIERFVGFLFIDWFIEWFIEWCSECVYRIIECVYRINRMHLSHNQMCLSIALSQKAGTAFHRMSSLSGGRRGDWLAFGSLLFRTRS